jgi:hypothetical protein
MRININQTKLNKVKTQLYAGLLETAKTIGATATQEIVDEKWNWTDGKLRDIVDTGDLRDSLVYVEQETNFTISLTYPLEYSLIVHEGGFFRSGAVYPARPWIKSALQQLDVVQIYVNAVQL